ncbi:MAG: glycosyltransferase [Chloroflexi bacterium]|nr:glycosyltransferase [Chloroflexota bacterium]MCI0727412.1 glycosyltransferase [Chloroflexota bacterium]
MTLTLLRALDRQRFDLNLILIKRAGEFLEDVPAGVPVYSLNAASLWTAWFPLAGLLRRHRPDVFFSTSGGANIPAVIAHKLAGRRGRLVLSERNTIYHGGLNSKRRLVIWLKKALYRQADQLTAVSQGVRDDLVDKLGLKPEGIQVVYNPVVDEQLGWLAQEPVDHPWFHEDKPVILAAGRLVAQKDFQSLIRAFARIRRARPARLFILGEGPLRAELLALADSLGVVGDMCLAGFDKNPFKYMARCTVFVLSSLHEGLPGVLIQAMACGAAVVATDCPFGPAEIISRPGEDGLLAPVGDAPALAEKIAWLLDHPEARQRMGEMARRSAERFAVEAVVKNYERAILGVGS